VGAVVKDQVEMDGIYYFSAPPNHCPPGTLRRHRFYVRCLRGSGIQVHLR
jgi:hypothetical protein